MLYLFSGDDAKKKISGYERFLSSLPKETEVFFMSKNDFDSGRVESFCSGSTLFSSSCAVVFQNILEDEEIKSFILDKLAPMEDSGNAFVFLEGKLGKTTLDIFKKARAELNVFELPKEKEKKFDNFLLANAFANRDKLNVWIYFRQAVEAGASMEELSGILFWKIKDMILRKNFGKFSEPQLKDLAIRVSRLLPATRKNGADAESAFERFLLEAF